MAKEFNIKKWQTKQRLAEQEETINEAPMDDKFVEEWETLGKALRNHLKHEMEKGQGVIGITNLRTLDKLDQIVKLAIDVPKKMSQIVDEGSSLGTGASFTPGKGAAYATPYAFKKKNKED